MESEGTDLAEDGNGPPRGGPMKGFREGYLHRLIPNAAFLESIIEVALHTLRQRD
jgi:hypothetical protein